MAQLIKGVVDTQIENLIPIGSTNAGDDTVIELSIKSNGQDFIFNNPTFELLSKKEDNTKTRQIKDITLLDGKVKIKADIQLTLCKGIVTNQLIINDGDKISTVYFYFMVNPSLENEVLEESKDKIESLDKLDKLINTSFSDLEAYENKLLAFSAEMDSIVEVESKREANELIRSTSEVKRISNEDSRIISEEDRIANEAIRVENEEARGLAESERVTNENNRRLAENTRKTQENARVAAEEQRQSIFEENENIRKEQEDNRVQAERIRKNKFDIWEEREGIRLISEDQRRESEEARQVSESNRDKAEKVREQQEANRQLTYNRFNSEEEERVNNENSRKDKENLRVLAENSRVAAEEERVAAENTRNSRYETAESNRNNTFNSNENKRQSDYESNEGTRNSTFEAEERKRKNSYQDAENTRNNSFNQQEENRQNEYTVAERLRVENENLRKNNEVTRGSNEETRKSNETSRVSSENIRVENENSRVAAEQKRQEDFKNIQSQYEHIINKNNTFKEEIVNENNAFKDEMNIDFGNAKTDYFGEEHLNVVDRLTSDFDNVHQRINDSSYLAYEGTNIKADNSYYGLTKELGLKGRTLQNLLGTLRSKSSAWTEDENSFSLNLPTGSGQPVIYYHLAYSLKPNTKYTIIVDILDYTVGSPHFCFMDSKFIVSSTTEFTGKSKGRFSGVLTTKSDVETTMFRILPRNGVDNIYTISKEIIILEGDYTNTPLEDIPFGEGIYSVGESEDNLISVKSCGKNLFDKSITENVLWNNFITNDGEIRLATNTLTINQKVKPNCKYVLSGNYNRSVTRYEDKNNNYIGFTFDKIITTPPNCEFIKWYIGNEQIENKTVDNVQIEENSISTPYSPYQESKQSYQLTEPLRSLPNGVRDEIRGNELIRRIEERIINGSEHIQVYGVEGGTENTQTIAFLINDIPVVPQYNGNRIISDKFSYLPSIWSASRDYEGINSDGNSNRGRILIRILKSKLSSQDTIGFKTWLQQNPTTVYYELAEPIIEKIEPVILNSFDGTTHINFENLLPGTITTKIPSNVQAVIQDTRSRNVELEKELSETQEELVIYANENTEILEAHADYDVDNDFRITMLELGLL